MAASVTHKPKAGALLTGTEYEAADSHTVAVAHADLSSVTANQHHSQAHALNSSDHSGAFDSVPVGTVSVYTGAGAPESSQTAAAGSLYMRTNGSVYIKASGAGNTGWLEILTSDA